MQTNSKYKIGEQYIINCFLEPEKMEYIGEIKTKKNNGNNIDIKFDIFKRFECNDIDIIALYKEEFLARSYDGTIENLLINIQNIFTFEGVGHKFISIGDIKLPIEDFKAQTIPLLTKEQQEESILKGKFNSIQNEIGEIKWCPKCNKIRQTTRCACGCGNCKSCDHRWTCMPIDLNDINLSKIIINKINISDFQLSDFQDSQPMGDGILKKFY